MSNSSHSIVDDAHDADIRNSKAAIERAALRARELAIRTNTTLIVNRNGKTEELNPVTMEQVVKA